MQANKRPLAQNVLHPCKSDQKKVPPTSSFLVKNIKLHLKCEKLFPFHQPIFDLPYARPTLNPKFPASTKFFDRVATTWKNSKLSLASGTDTSSKSNRSTTNSELLNKKSVNFLFAADHPIV